MHVHAAITARSLSPALLRPSGAKGVRAPNLGPIWAQRPRLTITERLLAFEAAATPRSLEMQTPIPTNLGGKWMKRWPAGRQRAVETKTARYDGRH